MFCSQKLFKEEKMSKCITLLNIYFFINEQIELFEYTFLRNKAKGWHMKCWKQRMRE